MKNEPIAIVGIGAIFPGAQDYASFWNNSLDAKCFVREIPEDFWSIEDFYDPNPLGEDKTYSKKAGILEPIEFNPVEFGIPPKVMQSISVDQLYGLVLARQALIDAGLYGKNAKEFDKTRTGVIMAASVAKNVYQLSARTNATLIKKFMKNCNIPQNIIEEVIKNYKDGIIEWDEASNPGYLANVVSGRIASRFNFTGTTCSIDSACASGLAAVKFASQELILGNCDVMIAGGITLDLSNVSFVSFCKTPALSKSDSIRPFDARADGMLLGDGAGAVVLKRLSAAEADGDRVYAVIEGLGSSSDGREKSIFSPSKKGQILAVTRAMEAAGVKADQVGMVEAHATSTLVGDSCEAEALGEIFNKSDSHERTVVIGGCKGQTGHMRLAAGIASLIRATLAIYHKQFVPTVGCEILNPQLENSIFFVCKKPHPWIVNKSRPIRYASVSAFGFGGTNYNALIREYETDHKEAYRHTKVPQGILMAGTSKESLIEKLNQFIEELKEDSEKLWDNGYTYRNIENTWSRIGFAAYSAEEAIEKAEYAIKTLQRNDKNFWSIKGIIYTHTAWSPEAKITALYSGQGSQQCGMLSDITGAYPEMRQLLTLTDDELINNNLKPISDIVYAKAWFQEEQIKAEGMLRKTQYTQPALAVADAGIYDLMKNRGFTADFMIGHSFGELVALYAAGAYDEKTLVKLAVARGRYMAESSELSVKTGMTAIKQSFEYVKDLIAEFKDVYIANQNSPEQIIIAGAETILDMVEEKARKEKVKVTRLNVSAAFHSPFMTLAQDKFKNLLNEINLHRPKSAVFSNYNGMEYKSIEEILTNLTKQLVNPVLFQDSVEKAYESGSRIFVEIGPGRVLAGLVDSCLRNKEDCITITASAGDDSLLQLETMFVFLAALGLPITPDRYSKKINPEIKNTKTKNSYSVPSTYFYLPETEERLIEARDKKSDEPFTFHLDKKEVNDIQKTKARMNVGLKEEIIKEEIIKEETIEEIIVETEENSIYVTETLKQFDMDSIAVQSVHQEKEYKNNEENDGMNKYDAMYEIQKLNAGVVGEYVKSQNEQFDQIGSILNSESMKSEDNKKLLFECVANFQNNCLNALKIYFAGQEGLLDGVSEKEIEGEREALQEACVTEQAAKNEQSTEYVNKEVVNEDTAIRDNNIKEINRIEADGIEEFKVDTYSKVEIPVENRENVVELRKGLNRTETETENLSKPVKEVDIQVIKNLVISTIAEITGYPDDMLETDMTLEGDLGIDSIKRLELFSNINDNLENIFGQEDMVTLAVVQTINECIDIIKSILEDPNHVAWSQSDIDVVKNQNTDFDSIAL